jgi:hypothetical protein
MKLFTLNIEWVEEESLNKDVDSAIEVLKRAKTKAKKILKEKGKKLKEWEIRLVPRIEYGYYDETTMYLDVNAIKK